MMNSKTRDYESAGCWELLHLFQKGHDDKSKPQQERHNTLEEVCECRYQHLSISIHQSMAGYRMIQYFLEIGCKRSSKVPQCYVLAVASILKQVLVQPKTSILNKSLTNRHAVLAYPTMRGMTDALENQGPGEKENITV